MYSTIISKASCFCYGSKKYVAYPTKDVDNQIIFSSDGILYFRQDDADNLLIYKSKNLLAATKVQPKSAGKKNIIHLFELQKMYVQFIKEDKNSQFQFLYFSETKDGSIICTKLCMNDFEYNESEPICFNKTELNNFLYDICYSLDGADDIVVGKYIFTDEIKYAKSLSSATSFYKELVHEIYVEDISSELEITSDEDDSGDEKSEKHTLGRLEETIKSVFEGTEKVISIVNPYIFEISKEKINLLATRILQTDEDLFEVYVTTININSDFDSRKFIETLYLD